ncbi:hypothetical protein EYR40_007018 [Pleurotus pulmonarius]|nr:hypothetical protein EYR36_003706 [Pleurotus pulmonarius]KAF4599914.1 hypothetical protein EYR40_007018 [Pleurotus pulmonarius]
MPSPYSAPSTYKIPVAPHPTPLSTSSFLTHSKASLNGNTLGAGKLKQPIYNPYDKFTQNDFDAWIGNITGALRRALGEEEEEEKPTPPEPTAATSERESAASVSGSPSNEGDENSEWDGVEDSFAEIKARRVVSSGKGKQRDPLEGPGLRRDNGGPQSPIEIHSESEEEAEAHGISEDEADEDEVGRAVSIDRWEETVREAARHRREVIAEEHEDAREEQEDSGGEYDEERWSENELEESALRGSPQEIIDIPSDDDAELELHSSPVRHVADPEGDSDEDGEELVEEYDEEEEEEEGEEDVEEEEQRYSSDARVRIGPPISHPRQRAVDEAFPLSDPEDEDEEPVEVIELDDDDDDVQPESAEDDNDVFPPRSLRTQAGQPIIVDPWAASRNYAEDFYAGGDSLTIPAGVTPQVAAHLLGGDVDETPFLTPGVVTPLEANASPYIPPKEVDGNDADEIQERVPRDTMPLSNFLPSLLGGLGNTNIDPALEPTSQPSPMDISVVVDDLEPQDQQDPSEVANIEFSIFPPPTEEINIANNSWFTPEFFEMAKDIVDDLSDSDEFYHERYITYSNNRPDNQGPSEAQGQPEAVISVGSDVETTPARNVIEEIAHEHQAQVETSDVRNPSRDKAAADDEPAAGSSMSGVVEEDGGVLDEASDAHMVDDSLMHVDNVATMEQTTSQPSLEQAITPPATPPKAFVSDLPLKDAPHTLTPPQTEYPMPVSADPNVSDPLNSTVTNGEYTTPTSPTILSMPKTPIYVLSPVGTPGGQPTPVSVPVSRVALKALERMTSGPGSPVNGLFTPASPRSHPSSGPSQQLDVRTLDEAIIKDAAAHGDLQTSPEVDQDVQPARDDNIKTFESPAPQPIDDANVASDADVRQTQATSSPLRHIYLHKPTFPDLLHNDPPTAPSRLAGPGVPPEPLLEDTPAISTHLAGPGVPGVPQPPPTMVLTPPRIPYLYADPYPYSLSTPGFPPPVIDYGAVPIPRQDNQPAIPSSVSQPVSEPAKKASAPASTAILLLRPSHLRDDIRNNPSLGVQPADDKLPVSPVIAASPRPDDVIVPPPVDAPSTGPDTDAAPKPESPKPMVMTRQKSTDPVLYADPYPYSLSTPGFEVDTTGSEEDIDDLDISMESTSSGTKSSDDKGDDAADDPMDDIVLRYPSEPKEREIYPDIAIVGTIVKPEEVLQTQYRIRSATPPIFEASQPADEVLQADASDIKPDSTQIIDDESFPVVENNGPVEVEKVEPNDALQEEPTSPPTKAKSPGPLESDRSHKRKRSSGSPLSDAGAEISKPSSPSAQAKGKGKATNLRPHLDTGLHLRRASSITSASSDSVVNPPSPTEKDQPFIVPPPLFLAHSHSKKPTANGAKNAPAKAGPSANTPSKLLAQRTLLSFISSPRTRSNCRFHKISLPKEEGGPRVCFLVPGCSLGDQELMEEEEIEDHGDATIEDSKHMVAVSETADDFSLDLIGILRQLVGVDLLREHEVYYLPSPAERARAAADAASTPKAPQSKASGSTSSQNRQPSVDSISSTRPPNSVAQSSSSIGSTSASRKAESDASSLSSVSARYSSGVEDDRRTKRRRQPHAEGEEEEEGGELDNEITIQVRRKPLKAARRNRRVDADQAPAEAEEEGNDAPETENRRVTRSLKRSRTLGDEASKSDKGGKKRRLQTQLTN